MSLLHLLYAASTYLSCFAGRTNLQGPSAKEVNRDTTSFERARAEWSRTDVSHRGKVRTAFTSCTLAFADSQMCLQSGGPTSRTAAR